MKKLYIATISVLVFAILLFISSFIYLDKVKHKVYYYALNLNGHDVGSIKIDKYETEDKLIYKSVANLPFFQVLTEGKSRLTIDKRYGFESYRGERYGDGASELIYLENKKNSVSFLSRFDSRFVCADNIPVKKDTFVFFEDSPVSYISMIDNYNFKRGRAQAFNSLLPLSKELPPMKRFVTLTSIRDEYITIGPRRVKTENLIVKIKNYPQGAIWVAKSDRSLVKLEMPEKNLKLTRVLSPKTLEAKEHVLKSGDYSSQDITFKNKAVKLGGTLTIPTGEGLHPAVLLVWGPGPVNRQYEGLFTGLADYLTKNGFAVLAFDKRGIGLSSGDSESYTDKDIVEDISAALEYLSVQTMIDPQKIAMISHSSGAIYAAKIASENSLVKRLVLLAPSLSFGSLDDPGLVRLNNMAARDKWSDDYLRLSTRAVQETLERVKNAKFNWTYVLVKRCFVKAVKEELSEDIAATVKKIKIPVLILQGKADRELAAEDAPAIDKLLAEGGNENHTLTYYGYLGHFFGKAVNDGIHKMHYEVDEEALANIRNWLKLI